MSWNVRGWTKNNEIIRKIFIEELQSDILCVSETHLKGNDTILIDNYKFLPDNITVSHVNAPKMFGGVGTFVKENLRNQKSEICLFNPFISYIEYSIIYIYKHMGQGDIC